MFEDNFILNVFFLGRQKIYAESNKKLTLSSFSRLSFWVRTVGFLEIIVGICWIVRFWPVITEAAATIWAIGVWTFGSLRSRGLCHLATWRSKRCLMNLLLGMPKSLSNLFNSTRWKTSESTLNFTNFNPHAPDRFTPSSARCAENCGSALTHHLFDKNRYLFYIKWFD